MAAPPLGSAAERHWTEEKERALIAFFSSESTPPTATCQLRGFNLRLQLPDFCCRQSVGGRNVNCGNRCSTTTVSNGDQQPESSSPLFFLQDANDRFFFFFSVFCS
ncbi:Hypothetical protein SMAX5B_003035 [Scophthalmus maximus]|uniref:Uncharacterized protein n=1 Tax=Scophthalmus maximus TaxID=52904 RepID=A0A2U9CE52_SCOMX|nr:Hypothetical protein SMAX5B_003035 [Scophthalmus maximus]